MRDISDLVTRRARQVLAAPPRRPDDVSRFTSDPCFGVPGIYPDGPPMAPADGDAPDEVTALAWIAAAGVPDAARQFADPALVARATDPGVRAGLVSLAGTIAEPVLDAFVAGALPVREVRFGSPASPGRIVGPAAADSPSVRLVNQRYRAEHPVLFAPSLAHDLLWRPGGAGRVEETVLHAVAAMVHVERLAAAPAVGELRTELARRQHSLAITLLNSRAPGSANLALVAPTGPGTIPGGAPALQTPDFWGVPFGSGESAEPDAPELLASVLRPVLGPGVVLPEPLRYDDTLAPCLAVPLGRDWLPVVGQLRAAVALGLVDP